MEAQEKYQMSDVRDEIKTLVHGKIKRKETLDADLMTDEVLSRHPIAEWDDSSFYLCCSQRAVREEVRREIAKLVPSDDEEVNRQMILPGFERLQTYYMIHRNGAQLGLPIELITDDELLAKAEEHGAHALGHKMHADEIRRYVRERNQLSQ